MLDRDASTPTPSRSSSSTMTIPLIPGLVSTQRQFIGRTNFHKGQLLEQMSHGRVRQTPPAPTPTKGDASPSAWLNVAEHHRLKVTNNNTKSTQIQQAPPATPPQNQPSTAYRTDATQPKWITHDRQVLRFFGFFTESITHETHTQTHETQRVRRVTIYYYLSDASLSISEPRVANSGLAQGAFMKRTVARAPHGSTFQPEDFHIGGHVRLYGRTIHLVDCDEATRTFYEETPRQQPQSPPCKYPDDRSSHVDEMDALKHRLREKATAVAESKAERVRKFHTHGSSVLRFFVSWRDPHPLYPETRQYVLHYYLGDDTIEIIEPRRGGGARDGRGHFAVLLSRRRMVSNAKPVQERDLRCGEFLDVFSRRFLLEDCDAFTRDYYLETHGITQEPFEPEQAKQREKAAKWKLFQVDPSELLARVTDGHRVQQLRGGPHTGTKATAQRFYQNDALENKQLRFRARFYRDDANDPREFVVTYFLADDTLAVFEPRVQNSGVGGGRFLDRGRFRMCDALSRDNDHETKSTYKPSDLYVGAVLGFEFAPQRKLELLEADRQTLSYCESHPEQFPFSNVHAVLHAITTKAKTISSSSSMRRAFRSVDSARNGTVHVADVRRVLEKCGLLKVLNAQQLVTLCRAYEEGQGTEWVGPLPFLYDDFCDALALQRRPPQKVSGSEVYDKLRTCMGLRLRLRDADTGRQRIVGGSELVHVAKAAYKAVVSNSEMLAIVARFPGSHRQRRGVIDYNALCDRVFDGPGDSDTAEVPPVEQRRDPEQARHHVKNVRDQDEEDDDDGRWESPRNQHSLGRHGQDDAHSDDSFDRFGADEEDGAGDAACAPQQTDRSSWTPRASSPRRHAHHAAPPLPKPMDVRSQTPRSGHSPQPTDARVVALLRRVFGDRKYQLRKALRDRDADKRGVLGEEAFMDAVLALEPRLADDDTYLIADAYFPTNNSQLDYTKLLESAFRS